MFQIKNFLKYVFSIIGNWVLKVFKVLNVLRVLKVLKVRNILEKKFFDEWVLLLLNKQALLMLG